jgi:hypothetical protein
VTNPFAPLSSGGAWIKPADHNGHLVIVANVRPLSKKFDEMRKADVDVATFDFVDVDAGTGWQLNVNNSHAGFVNKLGAIIGNPEGKVLARVGQVAANNGHLAWVLADATAEDVPRALAFLAANPLALPPVFTAPAAAPVVTAPAPVGLPAVASPAPAAVAPAQDVAGLLAQLQAQQQQLAG